MLTYFISNKPNKAKKLYLTIKIQNLLYYIYHILSHILFINLK